MGGFDHKYFAKLSSQFNIDDLIIDRPLLLKKFNRYKKSDLLKRIG